MGIGSSSALSFVRGFGFVYFGLVQGTRERGRKGIQIFWRLMAVDNGLCLVRKFLIDGLVTWEFPRNFR
jgi:hypothetical protein